jgi:type IV pilus assembly protein PilQ
MPHSVVVEKKHRNIRHKHCHSLSLAAMIAAGALLFGMPLQAAAQEQTESAAQKQEQVAQESAEASENQASQQKNVIEKISAEQVEKSLEITLHCSNVPVQTSLEQPGSGRKGIFVDIADAEAREQNDLKLPEKFHIDLNIKALSDAQLQGTRFAFTLPEPFDSYSTKVEGNAVVLRIENFFKKNDDASAAEKNASAGAEKEAAPAADKAAAGSGPSNMAMVQIPKIDPLRTDRKNNKSTSASSNNMAPNSFGTDGDSKLISVDFYKIDLHNVFRMLGEISGYNIVVAEGVSGTLTLSLSDVPWDFALDIILNLKDLAKQQQYNTIVIYPKDKEFVWPKRADESSLVIDQVSPEKDKDKEGVIVISGEGQTQQSAEVIEAKKFLAQAIKAEKSGELETAVHLYGKALEKWPEKKEKSKLANKVAAIYLAELHQNAKAVYFAKKALAADKKNSSAALNAAVGYANMEENGQAQQYFDQSISIGKPSREALFNYAVFSERLGKYEAALRLLSKYNELYGENLDSMVARARILDQQGRRTEAEQVYTAILHAGFSVPQDLRAFILARTQSTN